MTRFRPKLPSRLRGKRFSAEDPPDEDGRFGGLAISANEEILRMAAIAAVLSIIESGGNQISEIGRQTGPAWAHDHRQIANGRCGVLAIRSGRSTWR